MDHAELDDLARQINSVDFDCPFQITPDGVLLGSPARVYAPDVWHDDELDVDGFDRSTWEALTGMTGQYSYRGAVMHPSEYIGCGIAERLLELSRDETQTFVIVAVEDLEGGEPAGWAIMHLLS